MAKTEQQYRQDILDVGKLIYQKGWVAANDGNISVRLDDRRILCTCTGVSKGMMTPADIIVCDLEGNKIDGARERTTEIAMHLTIYQMRPDVSAVVHAHPPVATGFAVAGRPLDLALLPEVVVSLGCVPLAEYGLPGTPALTDGMLPYIPNTTPFCSAITARFATARMCTRRFSRWKPWSTSRASRWWPSCWAGRKFFPDTK